MSNKRNKPDTSFEDLSAFKSSKITVRSPTEEKAQTTEMEEIKNLLIQMKKEIKEELNEIKTEIKEEIRQIKEDINDMKQDIKINNEQLESINAEVSKDREDREREKEQTNDKFEEIEERMERIEKERIRNNLVISGVQIEAKSDERLEKQIEALLYKELEITVEVGRAFKIGQKQYIVEMNEWMDKINVLKKKSILKGKPIYIDSELTKMERTIQKHIREEAKKAKSQGIRVKVGYMKMERNGVLWKWNKAERKLVNISDRSEGSKN